MKNNFLIILIIILISKFCHAENLLIEAKNITLDKNNKTTIFKNNVTVQTKGKKITSQYAEFDKVSQKIILKNDIVAEDAFKNIIKSKYAEYNDIKNTFKTVGATSLITSKEYSLDGEDLFFDNKNQIIKSNKPSILKDSSGIKIYLENFEYLAKQNIFKSIGLVKVKDQMENIYEFSQIYIDTEKKEVLGTDIKAFLNNKEFKINEKNDPRIFANSLRLSGKESSFDKSVFTLCEQREGEKCPPWILQAKQDDT